MGRLRTFVYTYPAEGFSDENNVGDAARRPHYELRFSFEVTPGYGAVVADVVVAIDLGRVRSYTNPDVGGINTVDRNAGRIP